MLNVTLFLSCSPAFARDQFSGFKEFVDRDSLKPFTRDLGSVLGAATYHRGRSLGATGFDLGVRGGVVFSPSGGNAPLRKSGVKAFGLPWVQTEIGLPYGFDGYIRGISFQGLTIAGGGLRYGISQVGDKPYSPQFLLATSAHSVTHRDFTASHFGANLVCSLRYPVLNPYIGGGVDRTRVVVRSADLDPNLAGEAVTTLEPRFTLGFSLQPPASVPWKPLQFGYLLLAYTFTHGRSGLDSGLGVRF